MVRRASQRQTLAAPAMHMAYHFAVLVVALCASAKISRYSHSPNVNPHVLANPVENMTPWGATLHTGSGSQTFAANGQRKLESLYAF